MEKGHQNALTGCLSVLCEQMEANKISNKLLEKSTLSMNDVEEIQARTTDYEKNEKLIKMLVKKGPAAFFTFVDILLDPAVGKDYLVEKLNEKLREQKMPPVDIAKRKRELGAAQDAKSSFANVLIIVNTAYTTRKLGDGNKNTYQKRTETDSSALENIWKVKFGIEPDVAKNLRLSKLKAKLGEFSMKCSNSNVGSAFVFVISKGGENYVRCVCENQLKIEQIIDYFNPKDCPGLKGKPKLFFAQNSFDDTCNIKENNNPSEKKSGAACSNITAESESVFQMPDEVFIASACGQTKWCCGTDIKSDNASFIGPLVEMVRDEQENNCCIERLLTKVQNRIRCANGNASNVEGDGKSAQIPSYCSHLSRDFFFKF